MIGLGQRRRRSGRRSSSIISDARAYHPEARMHGVQVQQMVPAAHEVIVGAVTDPSFGKLVAVGLGGVLVEVLRDVTFRSGAGDASDEAHVDV